MKKSIALFLFLCGLVLLSRLHGQGKITVGLGSGAGTGSSSSITGNDVHGILSLTTGVGVIAGSVFTLSFNKSQGYNVGCLLYPANSAAALLPGLYVTPGTGSVTVTSTTALLNVTNYQWAFWCDF